jgi:hypothetical protein
LSLDKTIEEAVDETNFEEKLEEFIRRTAHFSKTPDNLKKKSSNVNSTVCVNNYYVSNESTNQNIESYTKIINKTDILADKSQACFHACECNRLSIEHAINPTQSQNCSPNTPAKNKSNFDISLDEMSFLKHAFSLVKFSMMGELFEQFKDSAEVFFNKMDDLARKTKDNLINTVASKFNLVFAKV